ncbi:MAG TPA: AbrB/MazE/SpoVT family DNA-binding domain-containing protein [bacterium]
MKTTLDRFGRVVVPKSLRTRLGLRAGAAVVIEEEGDHLVLRPVAEEPALALRDGILIFTGSAAGDLEAAVNESRGERMRHTSGMASR